MYMATNIGSEVREEQEISESFTLADEVQFRFNSVTGSDVILSEDGLGAHRRQGLPYYCYDVGVYVATPLSGTFEFELEILGNDSSKDESLEIGIKNCPKGPYGQHKIFDRSYDDTCVWHNDTVCLSLNGITSENHYGCTDLCHLKLGDRVGMRISIDGNLSFLVNGRTQGIAAKGVYRNDYDTYAVVRIYECCHGVKITRAAMSGLGLEEPTDGPVCKKTPSKEDTSIQFGFHPVTGKNVILSGDQLVAQRRDPEINPDDGVVYGALPLKGAVKFEVVITECNTREWSTSIQVGVMQWRAGTKLQQSDLPNDFVPGENVCMWVGGGILNKLGGELALSDYSPSVDLRDLRQNDIVGMCISPEGDLSFLVNGRSLGIAARNIYRQHYDTYPVIDVCGTCCAVKITRSEACTEVPNLQDLCIESISKCLTVCSRSNDVSLLPLPQKLKEQLEHQINLRLL